MRARVKATRVRATRARATRARVRATRARARAGPNHNPSPTREGSVTASVVRKRGGVHVAVRVTDSTEAGPE